MRRLTERVRRGRGDEDGFTLIELIATVSIMAIVGVGLVGIVISYLRYTVDTQGRMTESQDVQFAAAYWQRDVASIGVRPIIDPDADPPDPDPDAPSFDLLPSVFKRVGSTSPAAPCDVGGNEPVVTLAWTEFPSEDWTAATTVTVVYAERSVSTDGVSRVVLTRIRCNGNATVSSTVVADNLIAPPTVECQDREGAVIGCDGAGSTVPSQVLMNLQVEAAARRLGDTYTATLVGERRQT